MKILTVLFYSIEDVYGKILLSDESISPYFLLFYRAIISNSLALIFSFIFIFVELPDENGDNSCVFKRFWKIYDNKLNVLFTSGLVIIQYLFNLNIYFIIDKFSVNHFAIASIFENFASLLNSLIIYKTIETLEFFIRLILYFILIIASLIHNELIIINCCEFQQHTKFFLEKTANEDIKEIFNNNIERNEMIDVFNENENENFDDGIDDE